MTFRLEAPDQLGAASPDTLRLHVTLTRTRASHGNAESGPRNATSTGARATPPAMRWESALTLAPGPSATLSARGTITTAHTLQHVLGYVALDASNGSNRLHQTGWIVNQAGWEASGEVRARTRVRASDAIPELRASGGPRNAGDGPASRGPNVHLVPNPVSADTRLVAEGAGETAATIELYDVRGRWVRTLVASLRKTERMSLPFDARDALGRRLAPGIYLVHLESPSGEVLANTKAVVVP
jgi:hypothetical protein